MNSNARFIFAFIAFICICMPLDLHAEIELPFLISDGMVVQRQEPVPIWGWSDPNTEITLEFAGETMSARSDPDGAWHAVFNPKEAGGPYVLRIRSGRETKTVRDIVIGDVWLCSGQSNMEWVLRNTENAKEEIANSENSNIRHFAVPHTWSAEPSNLLAGGSWNAAHPDTAGDFTAVGYYFAKKVHSETGVPIGLLHSSWGGSNIESWMSPSALGETDEEAIGRMKQLVADAERGIESIKNYLSRWPNALVSHMETADADWSAAVLYNKMLHPLFAFPIKGVLWYQGESNANNAEQAKNYRGQFQSLINDWRKRWHKPELAFYWVQLANFISNGDTESSSPWAILREAQTAALELPNTGQAITIDVGNPNDIHPRDKKTVGTRLALIALNKTYGQSDISYQAPVLDTCKVEGAKVQLIFSISASELAIADGGKSAMGFEIAGKDGYFKPTKASIHGNTVVVTNESVKQPAAVRYAWKDNPEEANLIGSDGLPVGPFRLIIRR